MSTFIHISDLHLHQSNAHPDNVNAIKLVEYIIQRYQGTDVSILITGDITDDGCKKQYKNAYQILVPLVQAGFTLLPVPGNHDYGYKGNLYTETSQHYFQEHLLAKLINNPMAQQINIKMEQLYPMVTEQHDAIFIGLDSVVGNENELLHFASGEIGAAQRASLHKILFHFKETNKAIVVYFHHHPFDRKWVMEMDDAKQLLSMLASRVDIVCFGHDHKSQPYNDRLGIDWMLASGKSTKPTSQGKLQFREITIGENESAVSLISFKI